MIRPNWNEFWEAERCGPDAAKRAGGVSGHEATDFPVAERRADSAAAPLHARNSSIVASRWSRL
jgi:hypothetical protein